MTALAADAPGILEKFSPGGMEHGLDTVSSVQFYKGGIVVLDQADGKVKKGATAATYIAIGISIENLLTGASNTRRLRCRSGIFGPFANSAAADAIAADDIGKDCFIVDDATVALTSNSSARSRAGRVYDVDANGGVFVSFTFPYAT